MPEGMGVRQGRAYACATAQAERLTNSPLLHRNLTALLGGFDFVREGTSKQFCLCGDSKGTGLSREHARSRAGPSTGADFY